MSRRPIRRRPYGSNGQALAEFALVGGLFFLMVMGIVQFGLIMWSANTLDQVTRDTARWAVTQSTVPCEGAPNRSAVAAHADQFARQWRLMGYAAGTWTTAGPIADLTGTGVAADWPIPSVAPGGGTLFANDCPPSDSGIAWFVRVRISHAVPIFFPGLQLVAPSCGGSGFCLTSTTELRMEPKSP
ncbi:MAG: pilus assembly protein [Chloroflexi bacterium]|nr:pilus assembly protein [Chloroflexota bacterium]